MACALVIRGIACMAKLVTPASASFRFVSPEVSGARWPIRVCPERRRPISSSVGTATLTTASAPHASSPPPTLAPASPYSPSGCPAPSPAPDSTATSISLPVSDVTTSGIIATRRSPSRDSLGTPTLKAARDYSTRSPLAASAAGRFSIAAMRYPPFARGSGSGGRRDAGERRQAIDRSEPLLGLRADRRDDQAV